MGSGPEVTRDPGGRRWLPWRQWTDAPAIDARTLRETLDGGQAFRWIQKGEVFEGRWSGNVLRLRGTPGGGLAYSLPSHCAESPVLRELHHYLAATTDFQALADGLPWRSDPILRSALQAFPGLRILRQPLGETLFFFLCSPTKRIPQIKAVSEAVALDLGPPLPDGTRGLPSWETLARAGEARLRKSGLGYRAHYIHQTAIHLSKQPDWFQAVQSASFETARERLLTLPGVGPKIADCVLLFGDQRFEAFPIDTWIAKILARAYGLQNWSLPQLRQFARIHFGPAAGLAQQYLFAAARSGRLPDV